MLGRSRIIHLIKDSSFKTPLTSLRTMATKEMYTAQQAKLGRPVSPHVTIYAFPITAISSIVVRVTGVALGAGKNLQVFNCGPENVINMNECRICWHWRLGIHRCWCPWNHSLRSKRHPRIYPTFKIYCGVSIELSLSRWNASSGKLQLRTSRKRESWRSPVDLGQCPQNADYSSSCTDELWYFGRSNIV